MMASRSHFVGGGGRHVLGVLLVALLPVLVLGTANNRELKAAGPEPQKYDLYSEIVNHRNQLPGRGLVSNHFLAPPASREEFGKLLESLGGFTTGVELGVQAGIFAHQTLSTWPSCTKYYLVDLWAQQENYVDLANVDDGRQNAIYQEAQARLAPFAEKTVFIKNYTNQAVHLIPDNLDYVYVDARHDYCGTMEDMTLYWPKIRPGGILAGHDYVNARGAWPDQNWSICMDGTINHGAVMGAVNEFAMRRGLHVMITWDSNMWRSWLIRKPLRKRMTEGGMAHAMQNDDDGLASRH